MRSPLVLTLVLLGCGGRLEESMGSDAGALETGGDAGLEFDLGPGVDATTEWDVPPPPSADAPRGDVADPGDELCPSALPKEGTPCTPPPTYSLRCTYGDSVVPQCRAAANCPYSSSGTSKWSSFPGGCYSDPRCGDVAPKTGDACTVSGVCGYVDGSLCDCTGARWDCYRPEPGCPTFIPNSGSACTTEGLSCKYGPTVCGWGRRASCFSGRWEWVNDCKD